MNRSEMVQRVKSTGIFKTLSNTPGWVWIVIGGVVLLIVGVVAASAAVSHRKAAPEADE